MADLVPTICSSLDGYAAKPDGVFSPQPWSDEVEEAWSAAALARAGHLLYRRVNFEFARDVWSPAGTGPGSIAAGISYAPRMNALPKTVVSRTLSGDPGWNGRIAGPDLAAEVARLKRATTGDVFASGSATLAQSLWSLGLVDEFWLMVTPEIFGDGAPVFRPGRPASRMALVDCRALDVGSVILRYRRARRLSHAPARPPAAPRAWPVRWPAPRAVAAHATSGAARAPVTATTSRGARRSCSPRCPPFT